MQVLNKFFHYSSFDEEKKLFCGTKLYILRQSFACAHKKVVKNARDVDARSNPDPAHIVSIRQKRFMQVQQKQINIAHPVHQILH